MAAVEVKYNDSKFPNPQPFATITDDLVFLDGNVDHSALTVELVGSITGANLTEIEQSKEYLITGLSTAFKTLEIGTGEYFFAQPQNLNFQDSRLSTVVPYSVQFIAYEELLNNSSTTLYTGLTDLQDSWDFVEQDNKIAQVTHTVGARGRKISNSEPLDLARQFVTGRLNNFLGDTNNPDFVNFSVFLTGKSHFLTSRSEEIDRKQGAYVVTDTFDVPQAEEDAFVSGIIQTNTNINWTKDGGLTVSLAGSLKGGLTGYGYPAVSTGMFSPEDAKYYALKSLERSRSSYEDDVYGTVFKTPKNFNYSVDEGANTLDFNFDFADPTDPRTAEVSHEYTASVNATKDNNLINVSVQGNVTYNDTLKFFGTTGAPELSDRYLKVEEVFEGIDTHAIASQTFADFIGIVGTYSDLSGLGPSTISSLVEKKPFNSQISYNDVYSNGLDISTGQLDNPRFKINKVYSISSHTAKPTIENDFVMQSGHSTLPSIQIEASADLKTGVIQNSLDFFSGLVDNYLLEYAFTGSGIVTEESFVTGSNSLAINKSLIFSV